MKDNDSYETLLKKIADLTAVNIKLIDLYFD